MKVMMMIKIEEEEEGVEEVSGKNRGRVEGGG